MKEIADIGCGIIAIVLSTAAIAGATILTGWLFGIGLCYAGVCG